jgi:hypothetical protein
MNGPTPAMNGSRPRRIRLLNRPLAIWRLMR